MFKMLKVKPEVSCFSLPGYVLRNYGLSFLDSFCLSVNFLQSIILKCWNKVFLNLLFETIMKRNQVINPHCSFAVPRLFWKSRTEMQYPGYLIGRDRRTELALIASSATFAVWRNLFDIDFVIRYSWIGPRLYCMLLWNEL